ncbi:MAG: transcription termination factor Rho [Verrucomicrobiota bacterium]
MSKNTNEDTMPQTPAGTAGDTPPARKRAAKKATAKTTAEPAPEPVAKKAVARKTAVKKVAAEEAPVKKVAAKKAARKSAASSTPELPFDAPPASKPVPAPAESAASPAVKTPRAKKVVAKAPPGAVPASSNTSPPNDESPRRFGRVPGGGPVVHREAAEPRSAASPESTPFPPPAASQAPRENAPQDGPPRDQERRDRPPHEGQQRNSQQPRDGQGQPRNGQGGGQPQESRSKRRREKRKRRNQERMTEQGGQGQHGQQNPNRQRFENRGQQGSPKQHPQHDSDERRPALQLDGPKIEGDGMLELAPKGFGFLRVPRKNFEQARDDIFVTPETIRKYNLRLGQWIHGLYQDGPRGPQLVEITRINDLTPEEASKLPHFDELKAINPNKRISFETTPERFTTRVVDIMAPVGRGQRGLIVSPPRSGKTTLLLHMAEAIREKYDEGAIHLMVVLVDERPEEVTEFRRALPGAEIYASSNDEQARSHTRIAELAIERAKRLVEAGRDVFLIMDSITRLARAYNGNMNNRGRGTGSGGITIGALEVPRRLFAAARNTRGGGSLTIMATALIQTNSRADEAIYMEFKGTGNMELVLDRKIAENYIYPAVDIFKSGTRREELLLADHMLHKIHLIRRGLSGHRPAEAMERLLFFLKKFPNNPQMLLEIKG